jgi:hypothetical protein
LRNALLWTICSLGRISSDANSINLEGLQSPIIIKMGGDAFDFRLVSCITIYSDHPLRC